MGHGRILKTFTSKGLELGDSVLKFMLKVGGAWRPLLYKSGSKTYTSGSGSFTVPAGVTRLTVSMVGGGGSGGSGTETGNGGGGGGGGAGTYKNTTITVKSISSYFIFSRWKKRKVYFWLNNC